MRKGNAVFENTLDAEQDWSFGEEMNSLASEGYSRLPNDLWPRTRRYRECRAAGVSVNRRLPGL